MSFVAILALTVVSLVGVYVFFRLIFTAYYNAKKEYYKDASEVSVQSEKE